MAETSEGTARYDVQRVQSLVAAIAAAAGVGSGDAEILAAALTDADVRGVSTHGVSRLEIYVRRMRAGLIDPRAELRLETGAAAVLRVDAGNGLGPVQATKVLRRLIPVASANGIAAASIHNSNHFGALAYYGNIAAAEQMILLSTTNAEPATSPEGGCEPYFGTNPLCMCFPTGKGYPIEIDLATSVVARGNIIAAQRRGQSIPDGWALDPQGHPTTDAAQALLGTLRTMAGHKGYALAVLVEVLSGVLSGAAFGRRVGSMYKDLDREQGVGHFFALLSIAACIDPAEFTQRIDAMIDEIKLCRRRPGVAEILIPGEQSVRLARENRGLGIPIGAETIREFRQLCSELEVPFTL